MKDLGIHLVRQDIALDDDPAALFVFNITNNGNAIAQHMVELVVRFHPILSYPWAQRKDEYLKNSHAFDFKTIVEYDSTFGRIFASTDRYQRYVTIETSVAPNAITLGTPYTPPIGKRFSFCSQTEADAEMSFLLNLEPNVPVRLVVGVAGSIISRLEASSVAEDVVKRARDLCVTKSKAYLDIANRAALFTPDDLINKAFLWNKLNMKMEALTSPGIGKGIVAGYPDYPFYFSNDGSYSVPALLAIGQADEALDHLRLMARASNGVNNSSGKIIHELVTDGTVNWGKNADFGNTNETCQFAKAVGQAWRWTGDDTFLAEMYPTIKKGLLDWMVREKIRKGDRFAIGFGNAEVTGWGPKRLDVQCYAVEALSTLAEMALYLHDEETAKTAATWSEKIKTGINQTWWLEAESRYANSLTDDNKPVMRGGISATPLESNIAPPERAALMLNLIDHSPENTEWGWGDMSIGSGIIAVAQANYGHIDSVVHYVRGIARYTNAEMPGGLPEHHPPYPSKPEHTEWRTNTLQLWGGYGLHFPLVYYILGIQPDYPHGVLRIIPNVPRQWDSLSVDDVIVGKDDSVSVSIVRETGSLMVRVRYTGTQRLECGGVITPGSEITSVILQGNQLARGDVGTRSVPGGTLVTTLVKSKTQPITLEIHYR
jgi:hypothetical protein